MITSKQDLYFYITSDMQRNINVDRMSILNWVKHRYGLFIGRDSDLAFNLLKSLRRLEYAQNCLRLKSLWGKFLYRYYLTRFARLSYKYGVRLFPNTIGYGLRLPHIVGGGIILNCKSMGNNCVVNCDVVVGNKNTQDEKPTIGNNVNITTGCRLIGNIYVGDGSMVAPNSVVVRDVPSNVIVSGIPAKYLKSRE